MTQDDGQAKLAKAQELLRRGDLKGAESLLRDRIARRSDDPAAFAMLARLCGRTGRTAEARSLLERACALDDGNPELALALVDARIVAGDSDAAGRLAGATAEAHPRDVRPLVRLADIRMQQADLAGAAAAARGALDRSPGHAGALSLLVESGGGSPVSLLAEIERALATKSRGSGAVSILHFAAGRLCDGLQRFDEAFGHYSAANAIRRRQLERQGLKHNRRTVEDETKRLASVFTADGFDAPGGSESDMPVFVVGMARSGTSLTEQILASHPAVKGGGELPAVPSIAAGLRRSHGYPCELPIEALQKAARQYLDILDRRGGSARRHVDKMPLNVLHLGLIARMFPAARIVHCRRDPLDTCMSCFAENFRVAGLAWAYDLRDLGHMYCQYWRIVDHWRRVLPAGMMLEIDYEDWVADLEGQARRLIDFLGLEWDEACLSFNKTSRPVFTPSRSQVRRPIYASSIGRWRPYRKFLAPLIRELDGCGCGPASSGGA